MAPRTKAIAANVMAPRTKVTAANAAAAYIVMVKTIVSGSSYRAAAVPP